MKIKKQIAILIPAHNEEYVIESTIKAVEKLVDKRDIYIVDDGSTDNTCKIAKSKLKNILVTENRGKANAINAGINHFNLTKKYEFIFLIDADTRPKADFLEKSLRHFKNDKKQNIYCVIGRVKVSRRNWISLYRQWEYQVSYKIHKKAQEYTKSILVSPGCATIYRSKIFDLLKFPRGTMTEDMDFTFLMHRKGFSKMIFEKDAIVYTLDPHTVKDFVIQINRWYTGFWQVVKKHEIPWHGQMLDFEAALLAIEGLYNGILVAFLMICCITLLVYGNMSILIYPLLFDLFLFFIPSLIWSMLEDKNFKMILYIPNFYFLRLLSSVIFLKSFINGYLSVQKEHVWNSTRYQQGGNK